MSLVHVYPHGSKRVHALKTADCWCEPKVLDFGEDFVGNPARVFLHGEAERKTRKKVEKRTER